MVTNPDEEPPRKPRLRFPMAKVPRLCLAKKDHDGYHWIVRQDDESPRVDIWWNRAPMKRIGRRKVIEERVVLRQMDGEAHADVVMLTPSQLYEAIDALNQAVERP